MLSAVILSVHSYPAVLLAEQLVDQRFVHPGPLVLGTALLKYPTPTADRDRTVSRRSEPSSRSVLIGEQPNPWDLLQPQDKMSRHRCRGSSFHEWFMISLLIPRRKYRFLSWDRLILLWGSDYIFTLIYKLGVWRVVSEDSSYKW